MSNQVVSWSMFIVPWLTLFFMNKEDIKRYMPVGLMAIVTTTIIHDIGITLGFWVVLESAFPLYEMLPYFYGNIPVLAMWVIKFTYGRFWLYVLTNTVLDIGFAFFILGKFFPTRGIYELVGISSLGVLSINYIHMVVLYSYQMWQEGIFVRSEKSNMSANVQPAAAKPLDQDDNTNNE